MPNWTFEDAARRAGHDVIAGVDEAGRGPWAGPVVAGAVILDRHNLSSALRTGLDDSKKLKPDAREDLFAELWATARIGVGEASVDEIDIMNILQATMLAMARAVAEAQRRKNGKVDKRQFLVREPLKLHSQNRINRNSVSSSIESLILLCALTNP